MRSRPLPHGRYVRDDRGRWASESAKPITGLEHLEAIGGVVLLVACIYTALWSMTL